MQHTATKMGSGFERMMHALRAQKPAKQLLTDQKEIASQYRYWRIRILFSSFLGYAVFYFCRKNLSAATPGMLQEGFSKTEIGGLWSLLYLTYGLGRFINGIMADRANPRYFMAIGLFLSAIANIFFGLSTSLTMLGLFWALNGWFQGMGWPPSSRLLTYWYSPNERGTKWALWNISHQVGGGIILMLGGYLTQTYGWRSAFFVPAAIAVVTTFFLINRLRDTPESLGLPSIEDFRGDHSRPETESKRAVSESHAIRDILIGQVLTSRPIWFLALGNLFVYIVRYGAMDWAPAFLVEVKHSTIAAASTKTAALEFMGIAGSLCAGWLADTYFANKRWAVNLLYMAVLAFAIGEFWLIPPGHPVLDALALGAVGFLVYGPQMLVSVCVADITSKKAVASAIGFAGLLGYTGSIFSGVGTGWIVDRYGWDGGFIFFIAAAVLGAGCFAVSRYESRHSGKKG